MNSTTNKKYAKNNYRQQEIQILVRKLQEKFPMKNLERIQQQSPTTEQQRKHENFVKGQLGFFDGEDEAEDLHDDFQEDVADKEAEMMDDEDYDSEEEEKHILNGNIDDEEHEIEIEEDDEREGNFSPNANSLSFCFA